MPPKTTTSGSGSGITDPAVRAELIRRLEEAVKDPAKYETQQQQQQQTAAASSAATSPKPPAPASKRLAAVAPSSWLYNAVHWMSNWALISILLLLLCWARHAVDPLSHLIGFQIIVTDVSVIDGDSFRARVYPEGTEARFKLRLIDAPDMRQPYGARAAETLLDILSGGAELPEQLQREVILSLIAREETGGYYCDALVRDSVYVNATSVQMALVERGAAWALRGFHSAQRPSPLVLAMERAREQKVGLWGLNGGEGEEPVEPWQFQKKQQQKQQSTDGNSKKRTHDKKNPQQQPQQHSRDQQQGVN